MMGTPFLKQTVGIGRLYYLIIIRHDYHDSYTSTADEHPDWAFQDVRCCNDKLLYLNVKLSSPKPKLIIMTVSSNNVSNERYAYDKLYDILYLLHNN